MPAEPVGVLHPTQMHASVAKRQFRASRKLALPKAELKQSGPLILHYR